MVQVKTYIRQPWGGDRHKSQRFVTEVDHLELPGFISVEPTVRYSKSVYHWILEVAGPAGEFHPFYRDGYEPTEEKARATAEQIYQNLVAVIEGRREYVGG